MPNDGVVPIGDRADNGRHPNVWHPSIPGEFDLADDQRRSIDAGLRALAERRLKLICDTLDLPPGFFEDRALAEASQTDPKAAGATAQDPDIARFLDGQDGALLVDVVARVGALEDLDLQERLLRYLSCIDV